jgi:hypothetical protein
MAAAGGIPGLFHAGRIRRQLGAHLAAFLIALPLAASDISFNPAITDQQFSEFSRVIAQGIFATPVQPARASGLLSFDVGIAATAVHVDTGAAYWINSVPGGSDFVHNNYAAAPRLVVAKGFEFGTVSVSYAQFSSSSVKTYGGTLDIPIIRGTLATPEIAARATYAQLSGVDVFKLKTYGLEAFISKGFGPLMPYAAYGRMRSDSSGELTPTHTLHDQGENNRWTLGLRFSLFIPKLALEATQAQERSYSAKISFGF